MLLSPLDLSSFSSLAKRSKGGGVEGRGLAGRPVGLSDAGNVRPTAVGAVWLRGVKDAAIGFRTGKMPPTPGVFEM